jgi:hypothetical protein
MNWTARKAIWAALASGAYALVWHAGVYGSWFPPGTSDRFWAPIAISSAIAYYLSFSLARRIAREYESGSSMRRAWHLVTASSLVYCFRFLFEVVVKTGPASWRDLREWREAFAALALGLLVAGLIAMQRSFTSLPVRFSCSAGDYLLFSMILLSLPTVLWFREELVDAQSNYLLIRWLQYANPVLVATLAAITVLLHSISRQMGGGRLAGSLRLLMASIVLRALLYLKILPGLAVLPTVVIAHGMLWPVANWIFALAIVERWRMATDPLPAIDVERTELTALAKS